jgi:hypothetical protein
MPWQAPTHDVIALAGARVHAINAEIVSALPSEVATSGNHDDWPLLGWALLLVAGRTASDVHALAASDSAGSASTLARRLYEAVATFVWVAMDPRDHAARWLRSDRAQRIKMDDDLCEQGLLPLLIPEVREAFEHVVASGKQMPDVAQRAEQADKYWSQRTTLLTEAATSERSLRFMYRVIYRGFSSPAHVAVAAVKPHVTVVSGRARLHLAENEPTSPNMYTLTPILLGIAFTIADHSLGVPYARRTLDDLVITTARSRK